MPQTLPKSFFQHLIQLIEQSSTYLDGDLDELERISYHLGKYSYGDPETYRKRVVEAIPVLLIARFERARPWAPMDVSSPAALRTSLQKLEDELANPWLMEHRLTNDLVGELHDKKLLVIVRLAYLILDYLESGDDQMAGQSLAGYVYEVHSEMRVILDFARILMEGM